MLELRLINLDRLLDPGMLLAPLPGRSPRLIVAAPTMRVRMLIDPGTPFAPLPLAAVVLVQGGVVHLLAVQRRRHCTLLDTADRRSQGQAAEREEKTSAPHPAAHER